MLSPLPKAQKGGRVREKGLQGIGEPLDGEAMPERMQNQSDEGGDWMDENRRNRNTETAQGSRVTQRIRVSEVMLCLTAVTFLYADALLFQIVLQGLPAVSLLAEEMELLFLLNIIPFGAANLAGACLFSRRVRSGILLLSSDIVLTAAACAAYIRYVRCHLAGNPFLHGTVLGEAAASAALWLVPVLFCGVLILLAVTSKIPDWRREARNPDS